MIGETAPAVGTSAGLAAAGRLSRHQDGRWRDAAPAATSGFAAKNSPADSCARPSIWRLPADFLAADYGRGTFDLAGAYAAGLARGAQVRVDINGKSSGVIKLPYAGGDVFRHNQLFLPLSLMRPGPQPRRDLRRKRHDRGDATCDAADGKRFLLTDTSKIVLPTLAHVQRLPDLAVTAAGGLPFAQGGGATGGARRRIARRSEARCRSRRAPLSRPARSSPSPSRCTLPSESRGSILVVAPARALDPDVMRDIGLDPKKVEAAWRETAEHPPSSSPVHDRWVAGEQRRACRLPPDVHGGGSGRGGASNHRPSGADAQGRAGQARHRRSAGGLVRGATSAPRLARPGKQRRRWREEMDAIGRLVLERRRAGATADPRGRRRHRARGIADPGAEHERRFERGGHDHRDGADGSHPARFCAVPDGPQGLVRAPWTARRARRLERSRDDDRAKSVHYVGAQKGSLSNSRLVLAGWFSLDPLAFVAVAMLLALALSGTTLWFVRGVRHERPE